MDQENVLKERDLNVVLSTRQSFSQRQQQRLLTSFESNEEANARVVKRKAEEEKGNRKKKRNSPDPATLDFNREGLLRKVRLLKETPYAHVSFKSKDFDQHYHIQTAIKKLASYRFSTSSKVVYESITFEFGENETQKPNLYCHAFLV